MHFEEGTDEVNDEVRVLPALNDVGSIALALLATAVAFLDPKI